MKSRFLQWTAIILILITGYLHLIAAGDEYSEARYMGVLFLLNFLGSLVAAVGIYRGKFGWGWILGVMIAAGSIIGYIQSRTVGMPGMEVEEWYDPIGASAMIVEGMFLIVFALVRPWTASHGEEHTPSRNRSGEPLMYLAGMVSITIVGLLHLTKSIQVYQAAKDVCGITFAITGIDVGALLQSQMGLNALFTGGLFFIICLSSIFSAVGIFRQKFRLGWMLGLFIVAGSVIAALQSRIAGITGIAVTKWSDPVSVALLGELIYLIIFFLSKPWAGETDYLSPMTQHHSVKRMPLLIASALVLVLMASGISYQLGARSTNHNEHPLPETVISNDALEEQYGIRLTLVAVTAAGGMVDVRYRIVDPLKAAELVDEKEGSIMPMVFVGNGDVMLMSDAHMRDQRLIEDRMYFDLIPNVQNAVKRGTVVTVAFGDIAVEPTLAQ